MIFRLKALPSEFKRVVDKIDDLRTKLRYATQQHPRRWNGLLRRSTFARAIQGSNSIEGYNATYEDAVAIVEGEEPLDPKSETAMALGGYRAAMSYILQLADDPFYKHNEGTIRSLHYIMLGFDVSKHPGRWRPGAIFVRNEASGEIVYEGPDVELVPKLMQELIDSLNEQSGLPVMARAAMAHLNLAMVHPFSDGNGRMARALQTMVLAREGILDPHFSSIEEYLGHNTSEYYAILGEVGRGSWHPEHDPLPWLRFSLVAHYRQAETLLRRTKEMGKLWDLLEGEVTSRGFPERTLLAVVEAALGYKVRNSTYRKIADVSDQVAGKDLAALADNGLLVAQGERRGRFYVAGDLVKALRSKTRERKVITDPFTETEVIVREASQGFIPGLEPS